jgi:hypothetical protein
MIVSLPIFLAVLGTLCGLYYWYLGIVASGYLVDETERKSPSSRFISASLAWSVGTGDEYSAEGKKICQRGNVVFVLAILCWLGWGILK